MTNPLWINESAGQPEYNAQSLRQSMSGLLTKGVADRLGARAGVVPNGRAAVSLSGVQVTVHDCNVVLNPALSSQDGPYIAHFTEHTHTLDPGDGSNDRIDIVVARVYDDDHDGSGLREAVTEYIVGTPGVSPSAPPVPAGALLLARVPVPADGTGSPTLEYVAPATVTSGGVLPVRDDADLPADGHYPGMIAYDQGTDRLLARTTLDDWRPLAEPRGWEVLHDATISSATSFDLTERAPAGTYSRIRVSLAGRLAAAGRIGMMVNGDGTSGLHASAWTTWKLEDGSVDGSNSANAEVWPIATWATHPACTAEATIYRTDQNVQLSYSGSGCNAASGGQFRRVTQSTGHLTASRLISSLHIQGVAGVDIVSARVTIEGFRP